jgi:hypothetical protein
MIRMLIEEDFDDIRPYHNHEINAAVRRIISDPTIDKILGFSLSAGEVSKIKQSLYQADSYYAFQRDFTYPLLTSLLKKTSKGLTYEGLDHLNKETPYLFIANHRDIVLDSALLELILFENEYPTTEITFGSNLMINQLVIDLGKVSRMFKVIRGGNKKDFLKNLQRLSAYIRHTIVNKKTSIWIAQRPGRTKNGNDRTEASLLKMLNMSGIGGMADSFRELNIVPVTISYEYEPCCAFKVKEILTTSLKGTYQKEPNEDLISIITGLTQPKGRIHIAIGAPVNNSLLELENEGSINLKINRLANLIDSEIYRNYKLRPNNYIAFDCLNDSHLFENNYNADDKEEFFEYMENEIRGLAGERRTIEEIFLTIYANPLINALSLK